MEKTMENYIIRKLENAEYLNQDLKRDLKNLCKAIQVFKDHFVITRYENGEIKLEIDIKDKKNDHIVYVFDERAESLIELLSLLDYEYHYDD